jgi:PAS domain S-box-containing protein
MTDSEPVSRWIRGRAALLGAMLDEAPVGVIVYDRELRIVCANRALERMEGIRSTRVDAIEQVFSTGDTVLNIKGGYLLDLFPIRDPAGEIVLVGGIASVTDRTAADRLARELSAIVSSSDDAILSKDLDGVIRSWNAGAERLYGIPAIEAIGQPITIIEPEDRHGEMHAILARVAAGERVEHYETFRRRSDGSVVEVSLMVSPVYDDEGGIAAASVIARDVTERRIAESRRSAVIEAALDAIVTMDADGRIVEFNPAAERIFGYTSGQAVGRLVAETLVPPDQRNALRDGLADYHETGAGRLIGRQTEVTAMRADGTVFTAELTISVLPLERDLLFSAHIRDISARRETERALVESEERRRQILGSLLHAEEGERTRIATELHDDTIQVMTAALVAMDRVAMSARMAGNAALESTVVSARATLEEATDRARRLMFELRPAILHELGLMAALGVLTDQTARETHSTATLRCTPGRYDHGIEELVYRTTAEALANVRKHANPDNITVTIQEDGGTLSGTIQDDGHGFDIVEVKTRPQAALHLGLESLVERVRAAGGDLAVDSAPGKGTRIQFAIPLTRSSLD